MTIDITVPIATKSETNMREHWAQRHRRRKTQRQATYLALRGATDAAVDPPCTVKLTRISPRKLDSDNLRSALKAPRDGVADWLGTDDGDERITWQYDQTKGKPRQQAVRIEVTT